LPNNYFKINIDNYHKQKKNAIYKTNQLIEYIQNKTNCRSQLLAYYFGEPAIPACGICDNCKKQFATSWTLQKFKAALFNFISKEGSLPINSIELLNKEIDKGELFNYLRVLIDQGKVVVKNDRVYIKE